MAPKRKNSNTRRKKQAKKKKRISVDKTSREAFKITGKGLVKNKKKRVKSAKNQSVKRGKNGRILAGSGSNGGGRPPLGETKLDNLLKAVRNVESETRKNLLEYFVKRAFKSDKVLIALMKKLHPDLKSIEQIVYPTDAMEKKEAEEIRKKLAERFGHTRMLTKHD
jgi:hypothetical protein